MAASMDCSANMASMAENPDPAAAAINKKEAKKRKFLESKKLKKNEKNDPEVKDRQLKKRIISVLGAKDGAVMLLHDLIPNLEYRVAGQEGPVHSPVFTMEAVFNDQTFVGEGPTKKKARSEVADKLLKYYVTLINWTEADLAQLHQLQADKFSEVVPMEEYVGVPPKVEYAEPAPVAPAKQQRAEPAAARKTRQAK